MRCAWSISYIAVVLASASPAAAVTWTSSARTTPTAMIEAAPLRGAVDQPDLRGELMRWPKVGIAAELASSSLPSERNDYTDRHNSLAVEAIYYPLGLATTPVFVGSGLRLEQADIGRQHARGSTTWARTNADETNDTWVNHDQYLSVTESIGYRLVTDKWLTMSLRLVRDELLLAQGSVDSSGVMSDGLDLTSPKRDPVVARIVLHAGIWFH